MADPISIGYAVAAAIVFSLSYYLKKETEKFSWSKFISTGIIGGVIGVIAYMGGITEINSEFVIIQIGFYAGAIALLSAWIKIILNKLRNLFSD